MTCAKESDCGLRQSRRRGSVMKQQLRAPGDTTRWDESRWRTFHVRVGVGAGSQSEESVR